MQIFVLICDGVPVAYLDGDPDQTCLSKALTAYVNTIKPTLERKFGGTIVVDRQIANGGLPKVTLRYSNRQVVRLGWYVIGPLVEFAT